MRRAYECRGGHGWQAATAREYAASHKFTDVNIAVEEGMKEKAAEFRQQVAGIYKPV